MMLLAISALFTSCGGGDDDPISDLDDPTNGSGQNIDIEEIIDDNVSVDAYYHDYTFTFYITSKIRGVLPTYYVQYGIGHTYNASATTVSVGNQAYYYAASQSGSTENVTFENPFWYYYAFVNKDSNKLSECEMYYNSYVSLKNKSSLTSSERDLLNTVIKYLNKYESEVKANYHPSVQIILNGHYYAYAYYTAH